MVWVRVRVRIGVKVRVWVRFKSEICKLLVCNFEELHPLQFFLKGLK